MGIEPRGVVGGEQEPVGREPRGRTTCSRINREDFEVTPIGLGAAPARATEGGGATLGIWISNSGDGTVSRITGLGDVVTLVDGSVGEEPRGIVAEGSDVWVVAQESDELYRIAPEPDPDVVEATLVAGEVSQDLDLSKVCDEPRSVAAGFETIWITCGKSQGVARVDAESGQIIGKPIEGVGPDPEGIATDDNGVWVTSGGENEDAPGTVSFIDPNDV